MKISRILLFDTSIATKNMGDFIIVDAVVNNLNRVFSWSQFFTTATHETVGRITYDLNKSADFSFVSGTNLLSSNMNSYNQWKVNLKDAIFLENIILMGVGWWQYQDRPNFYTRYLFKKILSSEIYHSVRDSYTESQVKCLGFENVINTGCPTMWDLTPAHCKAIPHGKADSVVFTLTDYNTDQVLDRQTIGILKSCYRNIYFWPQGQGDLDYLNLLGVDGIKVLPPNLSGLDDVLSSDERIDYVGTRLHAGIRALQFKRRSVILSVDNRAIEINKDTGLCVLARERVSELETIILEGFETKITMPWKNIEKWLSQFRGTS